MELSTLDSMQLYDRVCGLRGFFHNGAFLSNEACVLRARTLFEEFFNSGVQRLLTAFSPDSTTENGGTIFLLLLFVKTNSVCNSFPLDPFWSGSRLQPTPLIFDAFDKLHLLFVSSAARLLGLCIGYPALGVHLKPL